MLFVSFCWWLEYSHYKHLTPCRVSRNNKKITRVISLVDNFNQLPLEYPHWTGLYFFPSPYNRSSLLIKLEIWLCLAQMECFTTCIVFADKRHYCYCTSGGVAALYISFGRLQLQPPQTVADQGRGRNPRAEALISMPCIGKTMLSLVLDPFT